MKKKLFMALLIVFSATILVAAVGTTEHQFITAPVDVAQTFYDYMPGSYNSIPLRYQSDSEESGLYMVFHSKSSENAQNRRVYYAYIKPNGEMIGPNANSSQDIGEGYPSLAIDKSTGNPFWSFHGDINDNDHYDCGYGYDFYSQFGIAGFATGPWLSVDGKDVVDNPGNYVSYNYNDIPGIEADEFVWPYTYIGESPEPGKRRIYILSRNYTKGASGDPSENALLAYADFDDTYFEGTSELSWNYQSFDWLDEIHLDEDGKRPIYSFTVGENGRLALFGYVVGKGIETESSNWEVGSLETFVIYSDDYGNSWNRSEENLTIDPLLPRDEDGELWDGFDDAAVEGTIVLEYSNAAGHFNSVFADANTLVTPMPYDIGFRKTANPEEALYKIQLYQTMKSVSYDFSTDEFSIYDIYPTAPSNEGNVLPWDMDADGIQDDFYYDDGTVEMYGMNNDIEAMLPVNYWDLEVEQMQFFENSTHITTCDEDETIAAVWSDSYKSYAYNSQGVQEYVDYAFAPEIYVAFSTDNGKTWFEPAVLSSVTDLPLENLIPVYVYPADNIKKISDNEYQITFMWLDDNSFGSSVQNNGPDTGGVIQYATIEFFLDDETAGNDQVEKINYSAKSYPNPYSLSTHRNEEVKIEFAKPSSGNAKVSIFNIKGQKVKTLSNYTENDKTAIVTWNIEKEKIKSGLYFYKVVTDDFEKVKKMIIVK